MDVSKLMFRDGLMAGERILVTLPERLQDHPVRSLRTLKEAVDVEFRVGGDDCADAVTGRRIDRGVGSSTRSRGNVRHRPRDGRPLRQFGGLGDRLLVARATAKNGEQP